MYCGCTELPFNPVELQWVERWRAFILPAWLLNNAFNNSSKEKIWWGFLLKLFVVQWKKFGYLLPRPKGKTGSWCFLPVILFLIPLMTSAEHETILRDTADLQHLLTHTWQLNAARLYMSGSQLDIWSQLQGGALSSCVVPAARGWNIHIHHAGFTKLLPYLSHILMFSLACAWGHKEARWRPGWGCLLKSIASKHCYSFPRTVVCNSLTHLIPTNVWACSVSILLADASENLSV